MSDEMTLNTEVLDEVTEEELEMDFDDSEEEIDAADEMKTSVSAGTIARTISQGIVFLNLILGLCGKTPLDIDESVIYTTCTGIATIGVGIWTWWKNNSFTKKARNADLVKNGVKETV